MLIWQVGVFAPYLMDYQQQDSQEFLRFLLDGMSEDLCRRHALPPKKKSSPNQSSEEDEQKKQLELPDKSTFHEYLLPIMPQLEQLSLQTSTSTNADGFVDADGRDLFNPKGIAEQTEVDGENKTTTGQDTANCQVPQSKLRVIKDIAASRTKQMQLQPVSSNSNEEVDNLVPIQNPEEQDPLAMTANSRSGTPRKSTLSQIRDVFSNTLKTPIRMFGSGNGSTNSHSNTPQTSMHRNGTGGQCGNAENGSDENSISSGITAVDTASLANDTDQQLKLKQSNSLLTIAKEANLAWDRYLNFNDSIITDIFAGLLQSTIECSVCQHRYFRFIFSQLFGGFNVVESLFPFLLDPIRLIRS